MVRRTLAVVGLALLASSAAAQIPEAPGNAAVAPRDEEPGRAHPVVPSGAPPTTSGETPTKPPKPSAHEIVKTMDEAKAAAAATPKPRHRRSHHRAAEPAR